MPILATVFPESRQFVGIGREVVPGTAVAPTTTIPVENPSASDKPTFIKDTALRGDMAATHGLIEANEIGEFDFPGDVYLDTIGYVLDNLLGDLSTTGSTPGSTTTFTTALALGATTGTLTLATGYSIGSNVQIGTGAIAEVVVLTGLAGSVATWAGQPLRFAHPAAPAASVVTAPYTHTFSLLNSANGQPPSHTITHYTGIPATSGARTYAYWCASEAAFSMNAEDVFTHDTKGTSIMGIDAGSAPANNPSTALAQANWRFLAGIGGPASGGTLISNITDAGITLTRNIKPWFNLDGTQGPAIIARNSLEVTGKLTFLAQDETPLTAMINNTQPILQLTVTNGLSGANLLSATFNINQAAYDTTALAANDELEYEVTFEAVANTTNAGGSGGFSPCSIVIVNAIPTY